MFWIEAVNIMDIPENYDFEASSCHLDEPCYRIRADISWDLSRLMPFLNAECQVIQYEPGDEPVMILKVAGYRVALRRHEITIGPVSDRSEGEKALGEVVGFLDVVWSRRAEITPNFKPRRRPNAMEIYKLLPRTNCGECGESSCMAFAVKLALGRLVASNCKPLSRQHQAMDKLRIILDN